MKSRGTIFVDLFCGAGGLTHGLMKSGIKVNVGIDLDPTCLYPFEANNPGAKFKKRNNKNFTSKQIDNYFDKKRTYFDI